MSLTSVFAPVYQAINIIKWFSVSEDDDIHAFVSVNKNIIEMKYRIDGTGSSSLYRDWMVTFRGHLINHQNEYKKNNILKKLIEYVDMSKIKYVFDLYFDKNASDSRSYMPQALNIISNSTPIYFFVYNDGLCKILETRNVKNGRLRCITDEYNTTPTFSWNPQQVYYSK